MLIMVTAMFDEANDRHANEFAEAVLADFEFVIDGTDIEVMCDDIRSADKASFELRDSGYFYQVEVHHVED